MSAVLPAIPNQILADATRSQTFKQRAICGLHSYFSPYGTKQFTFIPNRLHGMDVLVESQKLAHSHLWTALKVASYIALIIPLILILVKLVVERTQNYCLIKEADLPEKLEIAAFAKYIKKEKLTLLEISGFPIYRLDYGEQKNLFLGDDKLIRSVDFSKISPENFEEFQRSYFFKEMTIAQIQQILDAKLLPVEQLYTVIPKEKLPEFDMASISQEMFDGLFWGENTDFKFTNSRFDQLTSAQLSQIIDRKLLADKSFKYVPSKYFPQLNLTKLNRDQFSELFNNYNNIATTSRLSKFIPVQIQQALYEDKVSENLFRFIEPKALDGIDVNRLTQEQFDALTKLNKL